MAGSAENRRVPRAESPVLHTAPACAAVTETLREKFEEGLPLAVQLIETAFTPGWLSDGRMELDFESDRH